MQAGHSVAQVLDVVVLAVATERHIIKTRCSCLPPGPAAAFVFFNCKQGRSYDIVAGMSLTLSQWHLINVPGVRLPVMYCMREVERRH